MSDMTSYETKYVAIVGAGPAGISAAIQLRRFGISSVIFEQKEIGGLVRNANRIENYPGFPKGISGREFANILTESAKSFRLEIKYEKVIRLEYDKGFFVIETLQPGKYKSKFAIIASGTQPKKFDDVKIDDTIADKIFYEIVALQNMRNKKFAIVGAGDAAFDYALTLSDNDNIVTIINRSDRIKALELLRKRVRAQGNITYQEKFRISGIFPREEGLVIVGENANNNEQRIYSDFLIFAIGREPMLDFICPSANRADGIFFCGDVINTNFRQVAIAAGDGLRAAMQIYKRIEG